MTDKEKLQEKQQKKEQRQKAKEERKKIFQEVSAKRKIMKEERTRVLKLYAQKEIDLKLKYRQDLTAAGSNKEKRKLIKFDFKNNLFDLHNQRDYAAAKYYVSEKTQRKQKMKVDKRIAYKEYKHQHSIVKQNLTNELQAHKQEHKKNIIDIKNDFNNKYDKNVLRAFKKDLRPIKADLNAKKKVLKQEYKANVVAIKRDFKQPQEKDRQLTKAKDEYLTKVDAEKTAFNQKTSELKAKFQITIDPKTLHERLIDENNNYETKYIKTKVNYKNQVLQLKQKRDLSYEYELDAGFTIRRWFFGVGKEFQRMSWPGPKKTVRDLMIVLAITVFIALVFLIIDVIFSSTGIM